MTLQPEIRANSTYDEAVACIRDEGERRVPGGYQRIVFTNGCFDIVHPGHLATLRHARELAGPFGAVVVGINDDESCRRLKGDSRPILDQNARGLILIHMKDVDHVVTFGEDTPIELIEALRPDFVVKGGDYDALNVVGKHVSQVSIAPLTEGYSTSEIVRKIKNS